jgi:predicted proteasome-type protease
MNLFMEPAIYVFESVFESQAVINFVSVYESASVYESGKYKRLIIKTACDVCLSQAVLLNRTACDV